MAKKQKKDKKPKPLKDRKKYVVPISDEQAPRMHRQIWDGRKKINVVEDADGEKFISTEVVNGLTNEEFEEVLLLGKKNHNPKAVEVDEGQGQGQGQGKGKGKGKGNGNG